MLLNLVFQNFSPLKDALYHNSGMHSLGLKNPQAGKAPCNGNCNLCGAGHTGIKVTRSSFRISNSRLHRFLSMLFTMAKSASVG
jgi:hypothetical protein